MKKILPLLLVLFASYTSQSQVLIALLLGDKMNSEKLSFGLDIGMNSVTLTNISEAKFNHNFMLGLYFDIKLKNPAWSVHPGVDIKNTFGARNINPYLTGNAVLDTILASSKIERKFKLIYVPVTMRYTTKVGFGVEAGFQAGLLTKAQDLFQREDVAIDKDELLYTVKNSKNYHRIDFAWRAGVFYKIPKGRGVYINANFQYGMVDMPKNNPGSPIRNMGVQWSVSIPVGTKGTTVEILEPADGTPVNLEAIPAE